MAAPAVHLSYFSYTTVCSVFRSVHTSYPFSLVAMIFTSKRVVSTAAVAALISASSIYLPAQAPQSERSDNDTESVFAPMVLTPAPSATRSANGAPGPKYWQNRVDYKILASLDTFAGSVQASMSIVYHNNSPDELSEIWVHLEQNRFKGTKPRQGDGVRLKRHGEHYGYNIVSVNQVVGSKVSATSVEEGPETLGKIKLNTPVKSGDKTTIQITYYFYVPPGGNRMGRDMKEGATYAVAQWYPRVVVYDDVKGWNLDPYIGSGEFYSHLGNFDLSVTVPANYIVAATGELSNPQEVLTPAQISRLELARKSDTVVSIVSLQDLAQKSARPTYEGTLTWKFSSKNVRDAVWAASPNYRWDATGWDGILAQSFYRESSAKTWSKAADMTRFSVKGYSELLRYKYPYSQMSSVETLEGGMEYPMVTFIQAYKDIPTLFEVISHEVGHIWFPMIVNSNERMDTWMDEGINQFLNTFVDGARHPERGDQARRGMALVRLIDTAMVRKSDIASSIAPDKVNRQLLGYQAYRKPAAVFEILRSEVLGPELFDKALQTYFNRWAYKHPTPADLIRTFEDVTKQDLSWFWKQFIYGAPQFDPSIESVNVDDANSVKVTYANLQSGVLPIHVKIVFSDNTVLEQRHDAEVWKDNPAKFETSYNTNGKSVVSVEIDPGRKLVDLNRRNNVWRAGAN